MPKESGKSISIRIEPKALRFFVCTKCNRIIAANYGRPIDPALINSAIRAHSFHTNSKSQPFLFNISVTERNCTTII